MNPRIVAKAMFVVGAVVILTGSLLPLIVAGYRYGLLP